MTPEGQINTIVVGTSHLAEALRRSVRQRGQMPLGIGAHLRGLRRALIEHEAAVVICVALDECTLTRHAATLQSLLADLAGLPGAMGSIGLLGPEGLTAETAAVGCDVYVDSTAAATHAIEEVCRATLTPNARMSLLMGDGIDRRFRGATRLPAGLRDDDWA